MIPSVRRRGSVLLLLTLVAIGLPADPAGAAVPTCFGEPATIVGTGGDDVLVGTQGRDVIVGRGGNDTIDGGAGDDLICAGIGFDIVEGRSGDDRIDGGRGNDILVGGPGDDRLVGGPGEDELAGNDGNDLLHGGLHRDRLDGGRGANRLLGGPSRDLFVDVHAVDTTDATAADTIAHTSITLAATGGRLGFDGNLYEGAIEVRAASDGLVVVERVATEQYLMGIDEVPFSWDTAALEAQVVAARTYLANLVAFPRWGFQASYGFDICDSSYCQVYRGAGVTDGADGDRWGAAVQATRGQILLYQGMPAATLYHSTAGSRTRSIQDVWPGSSPVPYLQGVEVPPEPSLYVTWGYQLPLAAFVSVLEAAGVAVSEPVQMVRTVQTTDGGGPYRIRIWDATKRFDVEIGVVQTALNVHGPVLFPDLLPARRPDGVRYPQAALSPTFVATTGATDDTVFVRGEGWGHQLGMSQYGALAMARLGSTSTEILEHFYGGLAPEPDPGFLPDYIDVGLGWARSTVGVDFEGGAVATDPTGTVTRLAGGSVLVLPGPDGLVILDPTRGSTAVRTDGQVGALPGQQLWSAAPQPR